MPRGSTRTNSGKGAKYTRGRGPVELAYSEMFGTQSEAMHREAEIKKLSRPQKQALLDRQTGGEMLTVYDAADRPCGARPRSIVHAQGLRHHVCHLWVVGVRDGVRGIWLQKRQNDRPLYPGFYDLTATGHMDPGETPLTAALREAREEVGLHADEADVTPGGSYRQRYYRADGGFDDELSFVFLMRRDGVPPFAPGPEVAEMVFVPLEDLCPRASRPSRPPCARHGRRSPHAAARKARLPARRGMERRARDRSSVCSMMTIRNISIFYYNQAINHPGAALVRRGVLYFSLYYTFRYFLRLPLAMFSLRMQSVSSYSFSEPRRLFRWRP